MMPRAGTPGCHQEASPREEHYSTKHRPHSTCHQALSSYAFFCCFPSIPSTPSHLRISEGRLSCSNR